MASSAAGRAAATQTSSRNLNDDNGGVLSISLPSALKAARVSVSAGSPKIPGHSDTGRLSATERFYAGPSNIATSPQRTRTSFGPSFGPASGDASSRSGRAPPPPSILPHSGFLSPRKPAAISNRSHQVGGHDSSGRAARSGSTSSSPQLYPVGQPSDRSQYNNRTYGRTYQPSTAAEDDTSNPPLSRSGSLLRNGSINTYVSGNDLNGGTVHSSAPSTHALDKIHERSHSRQGTLASKASQEPLIVNGLPTFNRPIRPSKKRAGSKASSIGSLLGFTTPSSIGGSRRSISAQIASSPGTASHPRDDRGRTEKSQIDGGKGKGHSAITMDPEKPQTPNMRKYEIYSTHRREFKRSQNPKTPEEEKVPLGYGSRNFGGNTRYFCAGRLVTSGDSSIPFLGSFAVALLLPAIFLAFESRWLWSSSSTDGFGNSGGKAIVIIFSYLTLVMWSSMLRTSLRDPGIVVKGLDREPDWETCAVPVGGPDDLTGTGMGQRPKLRYFKIRDETVSSKWCETCQTYRPPRTSHCRLCDVCTEQTDHHCSFLNNCIGRRNYNSFMAFLVSAVICACFCIGATIAHLAVRAGETFGSGFWSDWTVIGSLITVVITGAALVPICGLLGYHLRLVYHGRTTIEMLRPKYPSADGKPANPYSYSRRIDNIVTGFCRPMDLWSAIDAHGYVKHDNRLENPAFSHPRRLD